MSLFILTEENTEALKRATRSARPQIKSSHLTEALAAALGFRTHAALRAALVAAPRLPPDLADCSQASFIDRLHALGYDDEGAVDLKGTVILAVATGMTTELGQITSTPEVRGETRRILYLLSSLGP
jgi:hypothetical protein